MNDNWNRYPEIEPETDGDYLVSIRVLETNNYVTAAHFSQVGWDSRYPVYAWRELPEPAEWRCYDTREDKDKKESYTKEFPERCVGGTNLMTL